MSCTASGFAESDCEIVFKLFDALGDWVADDTRKLGDTGVKQTTWRAMPRMTLRRKQPPQGRMHHKLGNRLFPDRDFTGCEPNSARGRGAPISRNYLGGASTAAGALLGGEFGWTLPNGGHPIPLWQLSPLLSQAGINSGQVSALVSPRKTAAKR